MTIEAKLNALRSQVDDFIKVGADLNDAQIDDWITDICLAATSLDSSLASIDPAPRKAFMDRMQVILDEADVAASNLTNRLRLSEIIAKRRSEAAPAARPRF